MKIIKTKILYLFPEENNGFNSESILLQTIRCPKNLLYLTDRLPKPSYEDEDMFDDDDFIPIHTDHSAKVTNKAQTISLKGERMPKKGNKSKLSLKAKKDNSRTPVPKKNINKDSLVI